MKTVFDGERNATFGQMIQTLRSAHGSDAHRTGGTAWGITASDEELGGREQVSESRASQAVHRACCAAAGLFGWAGGGGDS